MTQQPYAPQYPQAPAQQYPPAPQPQYAPPAPPVYAQPGYPPQGYPVQPQQPPTPPLANGTLDDFYNQPTAGGGPSISWSTNGMPKPLGTSYAGIVARDVMNGDVQQQTDPTTKQPKFYRDGRPQFVMKVPLKVQPSPEFPEGEATWFVRGQSRDELNRAMAEAGCADLRGVPRGGDVIQVTLVQRRPSRGGGNPANIVQVIYTPAAGGQAPAQHAPATEAPSPAPVAQSAAPAPDFAQQQVQAYAQQAPAQQAPQYAAQPQVQGSLETPWGNAQVQQQAPAQFQPPVQQVAPQQPLPAPAGLDPAQQELLARITAQQGAPQQ